MVAQQKIKDSSSSSDCSDNSSSKGNPGSPKSRLAMLKRSSAKTKTAVAATNDPFRFQGNGVDFKGKLIGEREVKEARGDDMCAEAMRLAKAEIKAAGKHKPRIVLNISIEGLKIKDEKTSAILYNFPVSKISFIARDTTDARAFGFVFGTPDNKYKFYGIKTAQTADHSVLSIRDMFQVVFEMKKKQIEEAKQKQEEQENQEREENGTRIEGGVPVADLLDLETELQTIQQVAVQPILSMPEDSWPTQHNGHADIFQAAPFGVSPTAAAPADPFGDSFTASPPQPLNHLPAGHVVWPGYTNAFNNASAAVQNGAGPTANGAFTSTNPFMQTPASPAGFNPVANHVDPFNTESAQRVISAIQTTHSYGMPQPINGHHQNGTANGVPEINWGTPKENTAPLSNGFNAGTKTTKNTTLEEAFSKLVDMDALVPSNTVPETKKNPFEHIINPPKLPLNALIPQRPAPQPVAHQPQQQFVPPTARNDPFNDDFFN